MSAATRVVEGVSATAAARVIASPLPPIYPATLPGGGILPPTFSSPLFVQPAALPPLYGVAAPQVVGFAGQPGLPAFGSPIGLPQVALQTAGATASPTLGIAG